MSENYSPPVKAVHMDAVQPPDGLETALYRLGKAAAKHRHTGCSWERDESAALDKAITEIKAALEIAAKQREVEKGRIAPYPAHLTHGDEDEPPCL